MACEGPRVLRKGALTGVLNKGIRDFRRGKRGVFWGAGSRHVGEALVVNTDCHDSSALARCGGV